MRYLFICSKSDNYCALSAPLAAQLVLCFYTPCKKHMSKD